ncbi:PQQ-binding-like beta-propeller repeat protein [Galbibacter pacificus]|uniref:PQQ-binding-like beta-propeller repeat protein n=1 Tax=Galbibacter pacificus TaxID=2996052 RepID=A0ABT6FWF9_9FLAO|nr:PQQ-binding-like beta-propeller repeat protein [Galbibacter pacificus]MDG3583964.1 PQQ-binding-like beta-propeller repeat protein [Galbibacter pacificus]MDG3587599.1 PQQ-binding-like beta-propeller repeat protein [Galbibacter pacificus]
MKKFSFLFMLLMFLSCAKEENGPSTYKWNDYLGGSDRNHYTDLSQITPQNVNRLKIVWSHKLRDSGQMQMNPIIENGLVYGVTAKVQAFALNAVTGEEVWKFGDTLKAWHSTSRGVAYWEEKNDKRILYTVGPYLYALNAISGKPISTFGKNGRVDLHLGLPKSAQKKFIISNTPGTVFKDLIIMPVRLSEGADAAPGDIRAFNVKTGALEWTFHTIPYPNEEGYNTWQNKEAYTNKMIGGANNWAGMAVDTKQEIIYVPTGSAAPDFYGGNREGQNLYANCLLALNASTGKLLWHYQFTHHDIWDRDLPAPPNLIEVKRNGKVVKAVAQVTKQGYVFVFNRITGKPLFDIDEVPVPASTLNGEEAWKTQPIPKLPKPFARQSSDLTEADISPFAGNKEALKKRFNTFNKEIYAPPGLSPVLLLPGYDGGAEWGGAGADAKNGILYVNANEMPWILQMEETQEISSGTSIDGSGLYKMYCATCHQKDMGGLPESGYPSLKGLSDRLTEENVLDLINSGKGMMPGFPQLSKDEREAILAYIYKGQKKEVENNYVNLKYKPPYKHTGYNKFLDSNGLPAIAPPWGTLSAIDLNSGKYLWQVPLGVTESLGNKRTGTENYGGPIITENGLLFIAATKDGYFRAFNRNNGNLLWETKLPAASFATPSTYIIEGKQYIVLACGGEKLGTPKGNQIIAFALENE